MPGGRGCGNLPGGSRTSLERRCLRPLLHVDTKNGRGNLNEAGAAASLKCSGLLRATNYESPAMKHRR